MNLKANIARVAVALVLPILPLRAGTLYASLDGWRVERFDATAELIGGCVASADFNNGEHIALMQRVDKQWNLGLGPFRTLREGTNYNVEVQITSARTSYRHLVTFSLNNRILTAPVSKDLMNELAADRGVDIWVRYVVLGTQAHGSMRLDNSAEAIRNVVHCRETVAARAPADKSVGEKEGGPSFGTGFFVADGYVLTNYHVIKSCSKAFVKYPGYRAEPAYEAGSDEINDLVLLRTKLPNQGVAEFRFQPKLGEPVASYGFPLGQVLAPEGNFTLGNITGTTGIGGDTRHFQMSAPIQPGNSGGPVLDMSGHVVGAAVASLSDAKMVAVTGQVPQNVNFAIAAPIAVNFLMNKEVTPKLGVAGDKLEPERLAETAKKFTVQVSCE